MIHKVDSFTHKADIKNDRSKIETHYREFRSNTYTYSPVFTMPTVANCHYTSAHSAYNFFYKNERVISMEHLIWRCPDRTKVLL